MKRRTLGRTGLAVSELGFGCGNVGGIMVRDEQRARVRAAARAVELGVNFFDTAPLYGGGQSELNLGRALAELPPGADVLVGTKVRLTASHVSHIEDVVISSVESSLKVLGRDCVDLVQLHNQIVAERSIHRRGMVPGEVACVMRAFESLQAQGKIRFWGITGLGETEALHGVINGKGAHTVQSCLNLLNPSAAVEVPAGYPFQDYGRLIDRAASAGMGVIAIRVLAAGALSGVAERHPIAAPSVAPISTGRDYAEDVARAQAFRFLVDEGHVGSLVEAAIRFVLTVDGVSTALVGISSLDQLEQAAAYAGKGPLPPEALARLHEVWAGFADEGEG